MTGQKGRAFSHKVRTGCTTCKQRRIKCDEGKPLCTRCIKGHRTCLGYEIPRANIFSIERPSAAGAADETLTLSALAKEITPTPSLVARHNPGFSPNSSLTSSSHSSSDDDNDEYLRSIILQPHFGFGNEEETRSLDHWLLRTSPMLSHYGPMGDFFTVVVPQLAWASPAIRHMLVALSMTHEKFMKGVAHASTQTQARAVSHYVSAITELRTRPPPQTHVLAAALLAWTMEMMQNNYPAAMVHLKASRSILRQCESAQPRSNDSGDDLIPKSLRPTAMLAQGLTAIVLRRGHPTGEIDSEYHEHLLSPWVGPRFASIVEARGAICECIEKIAALSDRDDPTALQDMEVALSAWFDGVRKWDQETIPSPSLVALILLFNTAMALLPGQDVAGYSYSLNPATVDFVVEKASLLLKVTMADAEDNAEALDTLRLVLEFVVRFFPHASSRAQALQLLRQIDLAQSDRDSGQTAKI